MRKLLLAAFFMGVINFLTIGSVFAADVKIGVIDTQKIMIESRAAKNARAVFLKDVEGKRKLLIGKQNEVQAMDEDLKKNGKDMAPQVRKEKADKLAREVKELKRLRSDVEEELKKKEMELVRKLRGDIREIVREYSKKEKYTVILEKRSVVASDEAIDITDKIIRLYNVVK
ncbi:OmpH family outer membrane protein [Thermodesulfobacteriota bacterium]